MADETKPSAGLNDETIVSKPAPAEPQRIGKFTVLAKLGEGGMGAVYKAHDPKLDRTVALKLLPPHIASDPDFVARFQREAATAAKFVHPNIVQVYAADEDAGTHFIAMEFVEGLSLQKHITNTGKLDSAEALAITVKAAEALQYAWNKAKLVHRDIKPDNILISNDGDVKVADLGLAKTLQSGSTNFTQTGTVMGSPHYISPEQGRGDKDVDFRSDIYSLGCTLFHMLTGRPPFEGDNIGTLIHKHIYEPPPDIATLRPDCPERVASLVKKMMAKDREKRFASYDELIAELTASHDGLGNSVTAGAAAKKRKMMMLAGAGVAVVAVVAGVFVWAPWKSPVGRAVPSAPPPSPSNVTRPVDDAFIKEVAALPAEEQVKRVVAKLKELNPEYDGNETHTVTNGVVRHFGILAMGVIDVTPVRALTRLRSLEIKGEPKGGNYSPLSNISPLAGMQLEELSIYKTRVSDLEPLRGMRLTDFYCTHTPVKDISPLRGMPLKHFNCQNTKIVNLSPLQEAPLDTVVCSDTQIRDLSPLRNAPLQLLYCEHTAIADLTPLFKSGIKALVCDSEIVNRPENIAALRSMKSLGRINDTPIAEFWKQVDAGKLTGAGTQTAESATPSLVNDAFIKEVAALPAEEQVKRVVAKLKELNPGYSGQETHDIKNGVVTKLMLARESTITNLAPVSALRGLSYFDCCGASQRNRSALNDLSPLDGLPLTSLACMDTKVSDLSPLHGAKLTYLNCAGTLVSDLTPLRGMPLKRLSLGGCRRLTDISPLQGMPVTYLQINDTGVSALRQVRGLPLKTLLCDFVPIRDATILRSIATLEAINDLPVAEFWKQVDAGKVPGASAEPTKVGTPATTNTQPPVMAATTPVAPDFVATVAALAPEKKLGAVMAKLKELNPNFDGKEQHKIEAGAVTELAISSVGVTDLMPVRALRWLKKLTVAPWTANQKGAVSDLSALKELALTGLWCQNNPVRDLAPLKEMALTTLSIGGTQVNDLEPLTGMKLTALACNDTAVGDLKPLEGMPLTILWCQNTKVTDLSPLKAAPLQELRCDVSVAAQNVGVLRGIKTLTKINDLTAPAFFMTRAMSGAAAVPNVGGTSVSRPFQPATTSRGTEAAPTLAPTKATDTTLSAKQQVAKFIEEMKKLNPGWDGKVETVIEKNKVVELTFSTVGVTNIVPLRVLENLKKLSCEALRRNQGSLADLSPLQGLKLEELRCGCNLISDLTPLTGMPLTVLYLGSMQVRDLTPLKGMPLVRLNCNGTLVEDLSPLTGAPLQVIFFSGAHVSDLLPLKGMRLTNLQGIGRKVSNLEVLRGMPLDSLFGDFDLERDSELLRSIRTLKEINGVPVKEFWQRVAAGDIPKVK